MNHIEIRAEQVDLLNGVQEFTSNIDYNELILSDTLNYMRKLYIEPLRKYLDISEKSLCDCGAGFGWLAFAYLLSGGKQAHIVEPHNKKRKAAQQIASILGVQDRCVFYSDQVADLNLPDNSVDIVMSVEMLEHVGRKHISTSVLNMQRIASDLILLTAPNRLSPYVSHDENIPLSHWFPKAIRRQVCKLAGKSGISLNDFPTPFDLLNFRKKFKPISKVLTFETMDEWLAHYPKYSPYKGGVWKYKPPLALKFFFRITSSLLGRYSFIVCPNLASVWIARK